MNNLECIRQGTITIAMIGCVANGKTTLDLALTGTSTSRFLKEKQRNMTLELGYVNAKIWECTLATCPYPWRFASSGSTQNSMECPQCTAPMLLKQQVSFVDSPGHLSLVSTLASGVSSVDACIIVAAVDVPFPNPHIKQHLAIAELMGVKQYLIIQNKIDLRSDEECKLHRGEIMKFVQGTSAEFARIVPMVAVKKLNVEVVCEWLASLSERPKSDDTPLFCNIVRSFDVNRPNIELADVKGGVIGGSIRCGSVSVGNEIEIRPGNVSGAGTKVRPIRTTVRSIFSESTSINTAASGGLVALGTDLASFRTKSNRLVGHVYGCPGTLPPVFRHAVLRVDMLRDAETTPIEKKEELLFCIGSGRFVGVVNKMSSVKSKVDVSFNYPVCAPLKARCPIFRNIDKTWCLIGVGRVSEITEVELDDPNHIAADAGVEDNATHQMEIDPDEAEPVSIVVATQGYAKNNNSITESAQVVEILHDIDVACEETFSRDRLADVKLVEASLATTESSRVYFYADTLPKEGEFVLAKVTELDKESDCVYVMLIEYNGARGMISCNDLSKRRVKSLAQEVQVGQELVAQVLRVDTEKHNIDLSRKSTHKSDVSACLERCKAIGRMQWLMKRISLDTLIPFQTLYRLIVVPSLTDQHTSLLINGVMHNNIVTVTKQTGSLCTQVVDSLNTHMASLVSNVPHHAQCFVDILHLRLPDVVVILQALTRKYPVQFRLDVSPRFRMTSVECVTGDTQRQQLGSMLDSAVRDLTERIESIGGVATRPSTSVEWTRSKRIESLEPCEEPTPTIEQ